VCPHFNPTFAMDALEAEYPNRQHSRPRPRYIARRYLSVLVLNTEPALYAVLRRFAPPYSGWTSKSDLPRPQDIKI
jgi:hypothetical protein